MTDKQLEARMRRAAHRRIRHAALDELDRTELQECAREARVRGWSLRRIAEFAGMSPQGVLNMVGK